MKSFVKKLENIQTTLLETISHKFLIKKNIKKEKGYNIGDKCLFIYKYLQENDVLVCVVKLSKIDPNNVISCKVLSSTMGDNYIDSYNNIHYKDTRNYLYHKSKEELFYLIPTEDSQIILDTMYDSTYYLEEEYDDIQDNVDIQISKKDYVKFSKLLEK